MTKQFRIRNTYTPHFKKLVVGAAQQIGNISLTARVAGVPESTAHNWVRMEKGLVKPVVKVKNEPVKLNPEIIVKPSFYPTYNFYGNMKDITKLPLLTP